MTEEKWLRAVRPREMLEHLDTVLPVEPENEEGDVPLNRKLRLFAVACCHRIGRLLTDQRSRDGLAFLERYLERQATEEDRREIANSSAKVTWDYESVRDGRLEAATAVYRAIDDIMDEFTDAWEVAEGAADAVGLVEYAPNEDYPLYIRSKEAEEAQQTALVREIFGNPFRPVAFSEQWRTSDVMLLARGIYEEKAFDRMPILADALQDAGCDADALLAHLRDTSAPHVRGCWALDLVLGKE